MDSLQAVNQGLRILIGCLKNLGNGAFPDRQASNRALFLIHMTRKLLIAFYLFLPALAIAADNVAVKKIDEEVTALDRRISSGDQSLPFLKVAYDFLNVTEGVPPSFVFYFEQKPAKEARGGVRNVLRAGKTHVGHEVYSNDYDYYFDSEGRPMKYLFRDSGLASRGPAKRLAVFYDKSGKVIWKSTSDLSPILSLDKIQELFSSLDESLRKF